VKKRQRKRLEMAIFVQVAQPQPLAPGQPGANESVDDRRVIERDLPHPYEMPQLVLDDDLAIQPVPRSHMSDIARLLRR